MIRAAQQSGRGEVAARLQEVRAAWQGYSARQTERGARQAALLREVDRVDRAAARVAAETARLRQLKDEAMEAVKRAEPGLMDPSPPHR